MRELGLTGVCAAAVLAVFGCKASPEPARAEASAPSTAGVPAAPNAAGTTTSEAAPSTAGSLRVYGEGTKTIAARPGERFGVALESNVTLPFKWRLDAPDATVLALVEEKQHEAPPAGCSDCVGTAGTKVFTFEAKAPGAASLHFALRPLTNPAGQSQRDVTVAVTVAP